MKLKYFLLSSLILSIFLSSCFTTKTTFVTPQVRTKIEKTGFTVEQLQYYIDRDIELTREVSKADAKLIKGNIQIEDGKYIEIVKLAKMTEGICITNYPDKLLISFEKGSNKFLTFGKTQNAMPTDPYRLLASSWLENGDGMIKYDGQLYHITKGTEASIVIKSKFLKKGDNVKVRKMEGVKIQ